MKKSESGKGIGLSVGKRNFDEGERYSLTYNFKIFETFDRSVSFILKITENKTRLFLKSDDWCPVFEIFVRDNKLVKEENNSKTLVNYSTGLPELDKILINHIRENDWKETVCKKCDRAMARIDIGNNRILRILKRIEIFRSWLALMQTQLRKRIRDY